MDAKLVEQVKATLIEHEGEMTCMYLDTLGIVTCGVGHALRSADAAVGLLWLRRVGMGQADANEIRAEYNLVHALRPGMLPMYYSAKTQLRLSAAGVEHLLEADMEAFSRNLAAELPEFAAWPDQAQAGMLDMAFQLGVSGVEHKFPRFLAAAKAGDWAAAAVESHREGIQEFRNRATKNLFLAAASSGGLVSAAS